MPTIAEREQLREQLFGPDTGQVDVLRNYEPAIDPALRARLMERTQIEKREAELAGRMDELVRDYAQLRLDIKAYMQLHDLKEWKPLRCQQ